MTLSSEVPGLIAREAGPRLQRWLSDQGAQPRDIAAWAIHPGGPRILAACGEALELDEQQLAPSRRVLSEYGNMSSPTVFFVFDQIRKSSPCSPCVMLGFGPGLAIEAVLLS